MKKLIIGIIIGFLVGGSSAYALRIQKPPVITEFNKNSIAQLNDTLAKLWNVTNGRYQLDIVTTNPDGATKGDIGDMLLLNSGGTYYLEINTTGSTVWRGTALSDTP